MMSGGSRPSILGFVHQYLDTPTQLIELVTVGRGIGFSVIKLHSQASKSASSLVAGCLGAPHPNDIGRLPWIGASVTT